MANSVTQRVPPYSQEAEQSVLGGLMLDNRAWDRVCEIVGPTDFYEPGHALIYQSIQALAERNHPFDLVTLTEALKSRQQLDRVGGEAYLFGLANNTPSAANIDAYADIVREQSVLRQLIAAGTDMVDLALNTQGQSSKTLLDEAERRVFDIAEQRARGSGPQHIAQYLTSTTRKVDELKTLGTGVTGLATGFYDFDKMTSGLQAGDLIIIAGRPSMGKTTFAMNIAEYAAIKSKRPTLIFSLEMPGEALTMRMMSSLGTIDLHKIRTGQLTEHDWPAITSVVSTLSETQMYIDDTPALTPTECRARARRVAREHEGLGLIVIDYLQLMRLSGRSENRTNEISEISRSLKALAKELNVPLIALSQLNRSLEQRTDRRPVMSDLRESGALEQDADLIVFIYRDEVYNEDSPDKGTAEIIIRKQRNGPIGDFRLTFLGQYTRFENYTNQVE